MQRIAKKYEADLYFDHGEVVGQLKPAFPTPLSLWTEAIDNSNGFVMAVLEFPLRRRYGRRLSASDRKVGPVSGKSDAQQKL